MRKLLLPLVVWILAVCSCPGYLWADSPKKEAEWTAQWITAAGAPQRDEVILHFRKVIDVGQSVPEHFLVDVSADNQFLLMVNGKRVGTGPSKADLAHWRFETYDLVPFLHAGKNLLAATVWNFGVDAAISQISERVGFLVHGKTNAERSADTDKSWEVEQEKGIATQMPGNWPFYYAAGPGERWEGAKFDWKWDGEPADGRAWSKAITLGRGALRFDRDGPNSWQLVADPLPPMEMREVPSGKVVRAVGIAKPAEFASKGFEVPPHTKASVLLDRSELVTGYPALSLSSGAGSKIRMTYTEALFDEKWNKGNRNEIAGKRVVGVADEFLPDGMGTREFMPLGWRTWRYLQIDVETADVPVRIEGLKTWFSAYPFEEKAYFRSDDPSLSKIWDIGWRTARLDAHDTYMDTPYWERLQYIGDTRIQAMVTYAVSGDDRLPKQAMDAFNDSRIPDGLTQSRYPSSLVQMIPTFSLLWVGMVHDFWMYRGDETFVRSQMEGARSVMDWYVVRQRPDGLLGKIPWWPFVDWGKDFEGGESPQDADGGSSVMTLQYLEALRDAAEMEEKYGDHDAAARYRAAADRASAGILKLCWNEKYGLLADTPSQEHFSQHANILGVWLDVVPKEKQKDVLTKILSVSEKGMGPDGRPLFPAAADTPSMTEATYYFRYYLSRAVEHAGLGDKYLYLLTPWNRMMELGLTTWAEQPDPTRSDSHAWSASPNYDLLTIVAGIHPETPGFSRVRITPELGTLHKLEAAMPTPHGMIVVKYALTAKGLAADVTLPEGVTGTLVWAGKETQLHAGNQPIALTR
jgi:alpha-L-rhamnosidase